MNVIGSNIVFIIRELNLIQTLCKLLNWEKVYIKKKKIVHNKQS